jgi:LytS/YehU family sensor histidine kinase
MLSILASSHFIMRAVDLVEPPSLPSLSRGEVADALLERTTQPVSSNAQQHPVDVFQCAWQQP